jgi:hypothetical protein
MLPPAFDQRLEIFVEASTFFRPADEAAEAFVVNRLFVDFAIRSTWA